MSRRSTLEKELKEIKGEFDKNKKILIEKSENDDRFIAALKKELERAKAQTPTVQTRIVYRDKPDKKENEEKEKEETSAKKEIMFLHAELDKKEKIIEELINEKIKTGVSGKENLDKENFSVIN
jgi:hypothetical protein